jgi:hypothetical protein
LESRCDLTDWKSDMPLVITLVLFLVLRNSKFSLTTLCNCFCRLIRLVVDVRIIGGGLPVLPGTASSFEVAPVPEASISMSAALRGRKIFGCRLHWGVLRRATFWPAPSLSLKLKQIRRWGAVSASIILANRPPSFFVALLSLVS